MLRQPTMTDIPTKTAQTLPYTDAPIAQVRAIRDLTTIRHTAKVKSKKKVLENLQCCDTSRAGQGKVPQSPTSCTTTAQPQRSETNSSRASLCVPGSADLCSASSGAADASGPSQALGLRDRVNVCIQRASLQPGGHVADHGQCL